MSALGQEIKRIRTESKLTQKQLAEKIGLAQPTVAFLENGRNQSFSVETLFALSRALGVPVAHWEKFFESSPEKPPPPVKKARKRKS